MNAEADHDLTGQWSGLYNYPSRFPPNSFEAVLRDTGGRLTGTTTEEENIVGRSGTLHAVIDGHRDGASVQFIKMYEDAGDDYDAVRYTGTVAAGGDEITGTWEVPGGWQGTFIMVRAPGAKESVERRLTEKIEL